MEFGFAPVQSELTFEPMLRQAALAESLGFHTLWAHEHHSQAMMYPAPLMTLAILARGTRRIRLGTNMLLLPLHHPLRVAEEAAMVDACSAGRLEASERALAEVSRRHFIIGEPSECIERIRECAAGGIGHLVCLMNFGKPDLDVVEASLRRFGEQVLPHCAALKEGPPGVG